MWRPLVNKGVARSTGTACKHSILDVAFMGKLVMQQQNNVLQ